jgi:ABC-type nickel/cobalt efflux system permease component RcnA
MTLSLLLLGFLIGMRHAVETDHVAAVASLATRSRSIRDTISQGAAWGLGHTLTLFLFGSVVLVLDLVMPERMAHILEFLVGIMLVGLGFDVMRRLIREKIHFHLHGHRDGEVHFHAHSHSGEEAHDPRRHVHDHPEGFPLRALFVGLMHGMAGSAALILLTLQTVNSPLIGLLYIALFGVGSMLGMALLSIVIAIPLRYSARGLTWLHNGLQAVIGVATVGVGTMLIYRIGWTEHLLF